MAEFVFLPVIIALANEAVPVAAIARSFEISSSDIREMLEAARAAGRLIEMPIADWPPNVNRAERMNVLITQKNLAIHVSTCQRVLGLTKLEANFLSVLLHDTEVAKEKLHLVNEAQRMQRNTRPDNMTPTDPKIVDVIICKLRKKLKPKGVSISTIWGHGYYIPKEAKAALSAILAGTP